MSDRKLIRPAYLVALCLAFVTVVAIYNYGRINGYIKAAYITHHVHEELSPALVKSNLVWGAQIYLRVFKEEKKLEVWLLDGDRFTLFSTYDICNYSGHLGPKLREGDHQSPEGFYEVTEKMLNPNSAYHLSFDIGFPNQHDKANGYSGSHLMIHGNCVSVGCYAITDKSIEKVYSLMRAAFGAGQQIIHVHVFPFRMTKANLVRHKGSEWQSFWNDLKTIHDAFANHKKVPQVIVSNKRYRAQRSTEPQ